MHKKSTHYIDDSVIIHKLVSHALTKMGFAVMHAKDGMEGLKELQSNAFNVAM